MCGRWPRRSPVRGEAQRELCSALPAPRRVPPTGRRRAGCPGFTGTFSAESPFSVQKLLVTAQGLSATREQSLLLRSLFPGFQGTNSFCQATRKQGQTPPGRARGRWHGTSAGSPVGASPGRNLVISKAAAQLSRGETRGNSDNSGKIRRDAWACLAKRDPGTPMR